MRRTALLYCLCLFLPTAGFAEGSGASLEAEWEALWQRVEDRHGQPSARGPSLQLLTSRHAPEYALDRRVSIYPLGAERRWQDAASGARFWVQSLDEFTLTNGAEIRAGAPLGPHSRLGLHWTRYADRDVDSERLEVEFRFNELAGQPLFTALRVTPRWEKEDIDAEWQVGATFAGLGEARVRLFALDLFINAAYALAASRDAKLDREVWQADWPLGVAVEWIGASDAPLRTEAYLGTVLEATTRYRVPADAGQNYDRTQSGWFAGALVEWRSPGAGLRVGSSILHGSTRDVARATHGLRDEVIEERVTTMKAYGLLSPTPAVDVELSTWARRARSTHTLQGASIFDPMASGLLVSADASDRIHTVRVQWMPSPRVGLEVGGARVEWDGPFAGLETAVDHRLLTRCLLQPTPRLWIRFGVGWDLDGGDGAYDGGGMTLVSFF